MTTADVRIGRAFRGGKEFLWEHYKALLPNQRAYLNAGVSAVVGWLIWLIEPLASIGVFTLAGLYWSMAMISDLVTLYKRIAASVLGKLLLVTVFAVGTNIAIATAGQTVNELTGTDPSKFPHTVAFVSLLIAPFLIAIVMSLLFIAGVIFGVFYFMFQTLPSDSDRVIVFPWYEPSTGKRHHRGLSGLTVIVQTLSFMCVGVFAYEWQKDTHREYDGLVDSQARSFLYMFEMLSKAPCTLLEGQRVAFLDGGEALIATKAGDLISFQIRECSGGVGAE